MIYYNKHTYSRTVIYLFIFIIYSSVVKAQDRQLVWSDEFNGSSLDQSVWSFELGQFNDCVHYSTDLPTNTRVTDGNLQLIALKESYQGYDYTASVIKTKHAVNWRYGRIEASIKLPGSNGFVPAFWLLPEDETYGWWPASGEIDIMEHPSNEITKIYGTIHSSEYNSFTGSGPRGGTIDIADAESEFHLYAVEWTPEKIDFFVDDQKYFTFNNENNGFQTWPFDHPFYIILNMAVGGGWVGNPTESTVFPAIMEVDYVRVYQLFEDMAFNGPDYVMPYDKSLIYSAPEIEGMQYEWSVPNTSQITAGMNTSQINVDWGFFTGTAELLLSMNNNSRLLKYPVSMSNNLLKNPGFEKGAKYWKKSGVDADFNISKENAQSGDCSVFIVVKSPGINPWDVQLSQTNLELTAGQTYQASFWAKSETNSAVTTGIINAANYNLLISKTFQLTPAWTQYNFIFIAPPANVLGSFNIDMGGHTGKYNFDDFQLNVPAQETNNQVINASFLDGDSDWVFITYYPAVAQGSIKDGEYVVSITNGGAYPSDVHIGQKGFSIGNGKEYSMSFDAYASMPREIFPLVGKDSDPWTVYSGNKTVLLSTNRKTYSLSFVMNETSDTLARLGFDIGVSSEDVFIDNVFLSKGNLPINVSELTNNIPQTLVLFQNWPNPFNPSTVIRYHLPLSCDVKLKIYSLLGTEIASLVDEYKPAGEYEFTWNASSNSSGVYFLRMHAGQYSETRKLLLVK